MDIDDILREVDPSFDSIPQETRDLQALTRAWVAERSAPELLPWPADGLFERVNDKIKNQIEKVEEMTGDMDPKTNFALIVIQTELERYRYLVRSYLRARIAKVGTLLQRYMSWFRRSCLLTGYMTVLDRQTHPPLSIHGRVTIQTVRTGASVCNETPGAST
jgi:hypothetical protein